MVWVMMLTALTLQAEGKTSGVTDSGSAQQVSSVFEVSAEDEDLILSPLQAKDSVNSSKESEEAVIRLVERYVQSINEASVEITEEIWMKGDFVSFIGPSGRYSTVSEIQEDFIIGIWRNKFTDRSLKKKSLTINLSSPTTAWIEFEWEFDATRLSDGGHHHTTGLETQVARLCDDGQWRLEHVHYSSLKN